MDLTAPILAIDTSTDQSGIGILGDGIRVSLRWTSGRAHTTSLLDQVDRCIRLAGLAPADLGGIAIAIGPGMFTSLRVGVSMAKGLAMGLDLPVVGLSTLQLAARSWIGLDREIVTVVAVGRGRVVWQRFSASGIAQGEPTNSSLVELRAAIPGEGPVIVAGEVPASFEIEEIGSQVAMRGGDDGWRDPLILAAMGLERFRQHGPDDLILLQPNYVHSRSGAVAGV